MGDKEIPIRLEWDYCAPICAAPHATHMDGIFAAALVQRAMTAGDMPDLDPDAKPGDDYQQFIQDLPFAKAQFDSGKWVWKASIAIPIKPHGMHRQMLTGRNVFDDMVRAEELDILGSSGRDGEIVADFEKFKLDNNRGLYRPEAFAISLRFFEGGQAWCVVQEEWYEHFTEILLQITAIGKKSARGYGLLKHQCEREGTVGHFRVIEDPAAHDLWQMRNLPAMPPEQVMAKSSSHMQSHIGATPMWTTQRIALQSPYWQPNILGVQCQVSH
jgi:CRISPR type IV-associated protein Csf3